MKNLASFISQKGSLLAVLTMFPLFLISQTTELTIDKIMQDPSWIGHSPSRPFWSDDNGLLYFYWNPTHAQSDSLYKVNEAGEIEKASPFEREILRQSQVSYNADRTKKVYVNGGDIVFWKKDALGSGDIDAIKITQTQSRESNPRFTLNEDGITYVSSNNLFLWDIESGTTRQLTQFTSKRREGDKKKGTSNEVWLEQEELGLIGILAERKEKREMRREAAKAFEQKGPKEIFTGKKRVSSIQLSPDQSYITFILSDPAKQKVTYVPDYVREDGHTENLRARPKVGGDQISQELGIYDIETDTVFYVKADSIPGIYDLPTYLADYGKTTTSKKPKDVRVTGPFWSADGNHAVVVFRSLDFKDRWIMKLDVSSGDLTLLDHQHDEAWIDGPGISRWGESANNLGWMPDNRRFWFQSEESGYSQLYVVDVLSNKKKALTKGKFEVFGPKISKDKSHWYFTSSEKHPGERHLYRMPLNGGKRIQLTHMQGNNRVVLSPDESEIAVLHSFSNQPWELYRMDNKEGAQAKKLTESLTEEWTSYPWRSPELLQFRARDGAKVYARLYRPKNPTPKSPAVIFVHGAGYLQNAHYWWSNYFREYMFHNMLADQGYTVLDMDFRASAGYGRDWRTAVYRHMGSWDLTDQVDGAAFLVENYDVDPGKIGIYGGSYGGFITLMAMFTEPGVFKAGAALRPVTDWAHYNHVYTGSMLNLPQDDSIAYVKSSPIYHAEGLQDALLICHGMVDTNVHFQDVVRLAQRLIELRKENWEVAMYPMEGHGFREPSSWADEYKRIFKLFEKELKP